MRKSRKIRRTPPNSPVILRRGRGRLRVRRRQAESQFDLMSVVGREIIDPGMPEPGWPNNDAAFLTAVLRAQRMPEPLVQKIAGAIPMTVPSNMTLADRLAEALAVGLDFAPIEEVLNAPVVLLAGPPGAGKTTLAAKLATRSDRSGMRFVSTDMDRSAGLTQIGEYAGALGIPLAESETPESLRALAEARGTDSMIVDTRGIDPADAQAWESLRPWIVSAQAMPVLVLPANVLVEDALTAARAFRALGGRHCVVTRFDMVRRVGGVLGAAVEGVAFAAVSVTPHFAYGLRPLTAEVLARRLLSGALEDARWQAPAA
jgi:SRP54-type protein, GTPase domain